MHASLRRLTTILVLLASVPPVLVGCGASQNGADVISDETFAVYYAAVLRAQEEASGDPDELRARFEALPLPQGWRERLLAFPEQCPKSAREWTNLVSRALARAQEPPPG